MEKQPFLLMMKPGFLSLTGRVYDTYVKNGFTLLKEKLMWFEDGRVRLFYYEHRGKRHFPEVCQYMTSDNVYPMVFSGSIEAARALLGPTDPAESHEGQIRNVKLLPTDIMHNIAHCSDGPKNAIREIALTFPECFYELFPGITEEYFAMEYPEIPREYYPQFTAGEAWVGGEHIVFSFFLLS